MLTRELQLYKARFCTKNVILSLVLWLETPYYTVSNGRRQCRKPTRYEQEEETSYGPVNIRQAKEYSDSLEKIQ